MGCGNGHRTVPVNHRIFLLFLDTIFVFFFSIHVIFFFSFAGIIHNFFDKIFFVFFALNQHKAVLVNILLYLSRLEERERGKKGDLHTGFISIEMAYNELPTEVMC